MPHATPILLYGYLSKQLCQFAICQMVNHPETRKTLLRVGGYGGGGETFLDMAVNFCSISHLCCFMVRNQKSSVAEKNKLCSTSSVNHRQKDSALACSCC